LGYFWESKGILVVARITGVNQGCLRQTGHKVNPRIRLFVPKSICLVVIVNSYPSFLLLAICLAYLFPLLYFQLLQIFVLGVFHLNSIWLDY